MMRRFFWEDIEKNNVITGDEAAHILRVLRMKPKDRLIVFDGKGQDYFCEIEECGKNEVKVDIIERFKNTRKPDFKLSLYQAVLKKDNMDFIVQKAVETGVENFSAFLSKRTVKRPSDIKKTLEKYKRTAIEAAKQCGRAAVPELCFYNSLYDIINAVKDHELCIVAYENEEKSIKKALSGTKAKDIAVIIGPEGGFEEEEIELLKGAGVLSCGLGKLILRAETAAVCAMAMILYEKMEA